MSYRGDKIQRVDANGIPQSSIWVRQKTDPLNFTDFVLSAIFITIGIIVLFFGAQYYLNTKALYSDGERSVATVVNQDVRNYRDSEGRDRTSTTNILNYRDSTGVTHELRTQQTLSVGSTVEVIYNPQTPGTAAIVSDKPFRGPAIVLIIGLFITCFSLFGFFRNFIRRQKALDLLSNGKKVMAKIVAIDNKPIYESRHRRWRGRRGASFSIGGLSIGGNYREMNQRIIGHTSQIFATWQDSDSGTEHSFRSYKIHDYLDPQLTGKIIPVFINPANPSNYYLSGRCLVELRDSSNEHSHDQKVRSDTVPESGEAQLSSSKPLF